MLEGLADLHVDADHHRSVFTILGTAEGIMGPVGELCSRALEHIDLTRHEGVHPRLGVVDVLPFVPLGSTSMEVAEGLRAQAAALLADELAVPCFLYGPGSPDERRLPDIRRRAFHDLAPDLGPASLDPRRGATAVGAREPMLAWNLLLGGASRAEAAAIAAGVRAPAVRALGLEVSGGVQVSCNLLSPAEATPADVADQVRALLPRGAEVLRAELVGLAPLSCLAAVDEARWVELDLDPGRTIESKADEIGLVIG